jgi:hypothetical protein
LQELNAKWVVCIGREAMLQDEYDRLAKSFGYISEDQAKRIMNIVFEKVKQDTHAGIVEIWLLERGMRDVGVLRSYSRVADAGIPAPQVIPLHPEATGLLVWVVEKRKPIWMNEIDTHAGSVRNLTSNENIQGRYFNLFDRTRAFAAYPVEYRNQVRGVLPIEILDDTDNQIEREHIRFLEQIAEPTAILMDKAATFEENKTHVELALDYLRKTANASVGRRPASHRTGFIAVSFKHEFVKITDLIENAFRLASVQATIYRPRNETFVVKEMVEQINSAHFCVIDITSLNQNVLIETGIIMGMDKPRLFLKHQDDETGLPFDIAGEQVSRYAQGQKGIDIFDARGVSKPLEKFVREYIERLTKTNEEFRAAREWYG